MLPNKLQGRFMRGVLFMSVNFIRLGCFLFLVLSLMAVSAVLADEQSLVSDKNLRDIRSILKYKLPQADVTLDRYGRVKLTGRYEDREEVDIAHSIVKSVVGVKWTSFVTPEVRVSNLEKSGRKAMANLMAQIRDRKSNKLSNPLGQDDTPPGPVKQKYALVIGVGNFSGKIKQLKYAESDAQNFYQYLLDPVGGNFKPDQVEFLLAENATSANAIKWLDRVEKVAAPDDMVIVYASTHGSSPDTEGLMAVVTYDSVIDQPTMSQFRKTSVTGQRLSQFVQNVKAKRKIMVLDTCYSGAAFSDLPGYVPVDAQRLGIADERYAMDKAAFANMGGKDLVMVDESGAIPSSSTYNSPTSQQNAWGTVLITASGPGQKSWEDDSISGSFFTHYFVKGMRIKNNIRDAFSYSAKVVPEEVALMKNGTKQTPQAAISSPTDWAMSFR
ncbi:MAG: caspase family protein [Cyclobacteriaceae bacterium]|nr:caspase family protein [Cyclobacteriaceae bacterium]